MISDLKLFQVYGAMARHAAESQKISATNVANADVPGFKAGEIESFEAFLTRTAQSGGAESINSGFKTGVSGAPADPNGNNVSLEREVFNSAEAMGQHNMALTVYSKSIDLLRTALGKPR
ncbi:MAG: FlgB family protein [Hyphomonas sp.]